MRWRRSGHPTAATAVKRAELAAALGTGRSEPTPAVPLSLRPERFQSAHWLTRTALCVEVRDPRRASGPKAEAVGVSSGVMTCFFRPRRTSVQGRKVSICTPPAGSGV